MLKRSISCKLRDSVGKSNTKILKREGFVPAVIYRGGEDSLHVAVNAKEINKELKFGGFMAHLFELNSGSQVFLATISDIDLHPVRDEVMHVDFTPVSDGGFVKISIPIHVKGKEVCPGCKKGGIVSIVEHNLKILCPFESLVEEVVIDISDFEIHGSVAVKNLNLPKGAKVIGLDDDFVILSILGSSSGEKNE